MAMQGSPLESGLRQLLAMRDSERQAALAALSTNHPQAKHQAAGPGGPWVGAAGAGGPGLEPSSWNDGGYSAGLAAGSGYQPSGSAGGLPMKVPLPASFGGPVQQEARAGPVFHQQARGAPQMPSQPSEGDRDQLMQSITNAMSKILLDSAPGQASAGSAAVREDRLRHIEWLRGQLEQQQEQSMRRISHMVDHGAPRGCPSAPAGPPAAAADQRHGPRAAQGQPLTGNRSHWPQEVNTGSAPQRPPRAPQGPSMKRRGDDNKQIMPVRMHAMPGWDPQLALAAAEAAGSVPSHWTPADAGVPPGAAWQRKRGGTTQEVKVKSMSGEETATQEVKPKMASDTLRSHLRALQEVDSRRVVQVRKISKLGFQSGAALESHYSAFGKVECVRVAFSHVKPQSTGLAVRVRPSGLGFVVMSSIEDAEAILKAGEDQVVNGVDVLVRPYEVREGSEKEPTNEDNNEDVLFAGA